MDLRWPGKRVTVHPKIGSAFPYASDHKIDVMRVGEIEDPTFLSLIAIAAWRSARTSEP